MYSTPQVEQLAMVKHWLGIKGLYFVESLTSEEKDILTNKFRLQFNETIKSLQFC